MWKQAPVQRQSSVPVTTLSEGITKHLCQLSIPWSPVCYHYETLQPLPAAAADAVK